jgi:hypothetical protein
MEDRISENVSDFSQFQPVTQPEIQQNEDPIRKDSLSDILEESKRVTIKMANLKKILERYGSPEAVQLMMNQVASNCMTMGNYAPLDMALDEITKWAQYKESRDYLLGS